MGLKQSSTTILDETSEHQFYELNSTSNKINSYVSRKDSITSYYCGFEMVSSRRVKPKTLLEARKWHKIRAKSI